MTHQAPQESYQLQLWVGLVLSLGITAVFLGKMSMDIVHKQPTSDAVVAAVLAATFLVFAGAMLWGLRQDRNRGPGA